MMGMANPDCSHCWHKIERSAAMDYSSGIDIFVCCWCGTRENREWKTIRDPNHGPHSPEVIQTYVERAT